MSLQIIEPESNKLFYGQLYYIKAKYLRAFKKYYKLKALYEEIVEVYLTKTSFNTSNYNVIAVTCEKYHNPKTEGGYWYIENKDVCKLYSDKDMAGLEYAYFLKIKYLNEKYSSNRKRILSVTSENLKKYGLFRGVPATGPFYLAIESKSSKNGFEIVQVDDVGEISLADYSEWVKDSKKIEWLDDENYNSHLGILDRDIVDYQKVCKKYSATTMRWNTFLDDEYEKLLNENLLNKNEILELKQEVEKYKALQEMSTVNIIKLLKKYNEKVDQCKKYEESSKNIPERVTDFYLPKQPPVTPVDEHYAAALKENLSLREAVVRLTLELNEYKKQESK